MKNKFRIIFVFMTLMTCNIACSDTTPFTCGKYGPNIALNPSADLAITATSQFGTPGEAMSAGFVSQGGWFLLDSFGAGALMGCQPRQSYLSSEGTARNNTYNSNGMLIRQTTTRDGNTPATLHMRYNRQNPFRIIYAEQFCFDFVNTTLNRFYFNYSNNKLTKISIVPDSSCPISGPFTVSYSYDSTSAPNMPSKEVMVEHDGDTTTNTYTYNVTAGLMQSIVTNFYGTFTYTYDAGLLSEISWPNAIQNVTYRGETQWKSMLDGRFGWGLTIDYNGDNTVESTLQNTGCPSCPASHYRY